jgi:hypothetical protein
MDARSNAASKSSASIEAVRVSPETSFVNSKA